jgi:uncharacterized repeat protein (TIGR03806 family)
MQSTSRMRADLRYSLLLMAGLSSLSPLAAPSDPVGQPYAIASHVVAHPYLRMPARPDGPIPKLLSQTGAFKDTAHLVPSDELIPYDLIIPFWSDGAQKLRWIALPAGKIEFSPTGEWVFPAGTVFVKTFELPVDARDPKLQRRLETRLLMVEGGGLVYGVVYKWRPDLTDADLLPGGLRESVPITNAAGQTHAQTWDYPSRKDCITCHTKLSGGVLGVKTRQMNHDFAYPSGVADNELREWNHLGLFAAPLREADINDLPRAAAPNDESRSVADRARSYLDANCSQCHRPGGTVAGFDARYVTPLDRQELVNGPVLLDEGIDRPRIISPHDIWRSIAYMRIDTVGAIRMPPIDRETIDEQGVALMRNWIDSMPGRAVLAPPLIEPAGGTFNKPVAIRLTDSQADADIRYTLDGSVPGPSDARYDKPIVLSGPAVVRARAFKNGFTHSVTAQEVFVVAQ